MSKKGIKKNQSNTEARNRTAESEEESTARALKYYKRAFEHLLSRAEHDIIVLESCVRAAAASPSAAVLDAAVSHADATLEPRPSGVEALRRLLIVVRQARFPDDSWQKRIKQLATQNPPEFKGQIAIVAGTCDPRRIDEVHGFAHWVGEAFAEFRGTVISGGTREGISGLIGELGRRAGQRIHTIGYLPAVLPADGTASIDSRYHELHRSPGEHGFSVLEPLQAWIDLIASGIDPRDVVLIGFGGGEIAAIEYLIACALGAQTGVLAGSGGAAALVAQSQTGGSEIRPIQLPADALTLQRFVSRPQSSTLKSVAREQIARAIHDHYRDTRGRQSTGDDPAMQPWEMLREDFKNSNRQAADDIGLKMAAVGLQIVKSKSRRPSARPLGKKQIEHLAEREHARWNVERLIAGWIYGPTADKDKKISPYLVPWAEIPDHIREYDREPVRAIPKMLADAGFELQPLKRSSRR